MGEDKINIDYCKLENPRSRLVTEVICFSDTLRFYLNESIIKAADLLR